MPKIFEGLLGQQLEEAAHNHERVTLYFSRGNNLRGTIEELDSRFYTALIKQDDGCAAIVQLGYCIRVDRHSPKKLPEEDSEELPTDKDGNHIKEVDQE